MPLLRLTYSGNVYDASPAGTVDFPLITKAGHPIPYLQKGHIHVYSSADHGVTWTELSRPQQWDFDSTGTIVRLAAGIGAGQQVKVQRSTPRDSKYTTFQDSSLLTAEQLNEAEDFHLYVSQEINDLIGNSWSVLADTVTTADQKAAAWASDDSHVATTGALSERFDVIMSGTKPPDPPVSEYRQGGKLWIDTAQLEISYWDPVVRAWVNLTDAGPPGPPGGGVSEVIGVDPIQVANATATPVVSITPATAQAAGSMSAGDKTKLDGLQQYTLPIASAATLGGIRVGNNLVIDPATGVLSGNLPGALVYKGIRDVTKPAPTVLAVGHVYVNNTAGVADPTWIGLVGSIAAGDMLLWDGFAWGVVGSSSNAGVLSVTGESPVRIGGTAAQPEVSVELAVPSASGVGGSSGLMSAADKEKLNGLGGGGGGSGSVASVTGIAPIKVATGTTTPAISVDAATTSAPGVVQLADVTAVNAGTAGRIVDAAQLRGVRTEAASLYQPLSGMSTYLTTANAASVYQPISAMGNYAPKASPTFTGVSTFAAGTAAAPGLVVGAEAGTGLWSPGSGQLALSLAGVEKVKYASNRMQVSMSQDTAVIAVAALNIDCSLGNFFTKTINGNSVFTVSNVPSGRSYSFVLELTHTSGTVTWFSGVEWPGGTAPTLTAGKTHVFVFQTINGGTRWRGAAYTNYTN